MPKQIYMNRKERKHEHGLCQIAVFTFIEYDTQTMCKYVRMKNKIPESKFEYFSEMKYEN